MPAPAKRALILFINFFLIILAYYHIKPASRSLFVEYLGADRLPYVWIGTALVLGVLIGYYHRLVERHSRLAVVLGSCLLFMVLLVLFRVGLAQGRPVAAVSFYIFVDIFSVILVEQFWSLANTVYSTDEGKRWYGFVGTGGLVGGVMGGAVAAMLLDLTPITTVDLLLVAAGILGLIVLVNLMMARMGVYRETPAETLKPVAAGGWRSLVGNRYLILIAAILLFAQFAQPVVEYQFIKTVEAAYDALDQRTAFISRFFSLMGLVSIAVNLGITPLVHRTLGVIAGLASQPLLLAISSFGFMLQPTLAMSSVMKICDRGLSYSINRASKELLYVPIDPVRVYQAKAWIDMFGYRLFKVLGSLMILVLTQWLPLGVTVAQLSWMTLAVCSVWLLTLGSIAREYRALVPATA